MVRVALTKIRNEQLRPIASYGLWPWILDPQKINKSFCLLLFFITSLCFVMYASLSLLLGKNILKFEYLLSEETLIL